MNTTPNIPYYFSAWTGYSFPVKPHGPIDYERAESYEGFDIFFFDQNGRVVRLESWSAVSTKIDQSLVSQLVLNPGANFFSANTSLPEKLGERLSLEATKNLTDYYRARVNPNGTVVSCERIHREITLCHEYTYWDNGQLREMHFKTISQAGIQRFDWNGKEIDAK